MKQEAGRRPDDKSLGDENEESKDPNKGKDKQKKTK